MVSAHLSCAVLGFKSGYCMLHTQPHSRSLGVMRHSSGISASASVGAAAVTTGMSGLVARVVAVGVCECCVRMRMGTCFVFVAVCWLLGVYRSSCTVCTLIMNVSAVSVFHQHTAGTACVFRISQSQFHTRHVACSAAI